MTKTLATAICEVCGDEFRVRRSGPGRPARYCKQACRQEAYRRRHAPSTAELRADVAAQLEQIAPLDVVALRAVLPGLDASALGDLRRHLVAVTGPLTALAGLTAPHRPVPPTGQPAPVTAESVTPLPVTPTPAAAPKRSALPAVIGGLRPTDEQAAIIDACAGGGHLVIEAGAGTGKTSTLRMAATGMPGRGLYIAFNKAIATDAKKSFPKHVSCSTAHSLAYQAVGHAYRARLHGSRLPAHQAAVVLGVTGPIQASAERTIEPPQLARLALDTVARFCRTADDELSVAHVPSVNGVDGLAAAALAEYVLPYAKAAWADLQQTSGRLHFLHDHYLKMWALTRPTLDADFILFDEAQDADPLIASIVQAQTCQLIAVGDECQAIYGWRGAVDALRTWPAQQRLLLSQSWRFGPAIAEEANKWLGLLGARLRLSGTPTVASTIAGLDRPRAILCRTNAEAISQAMAAMDAGRKAGLVGGGATIKKMAQAAIALQQGRKTDHPELFAFKTWAEVQDYVQQDSAGRDLAVFVRLVDEFGAEEIVHAADRLSDERYCDVVISTAHKAKGREWDTVKIGSDFRQPKADDDGRPGQVPRDAAMLAYVSVTRAKRTLDRGGLAWIDDQLAGVVSADRRPRRRMDDAYTALREDW